MSTTQKPYFLSDEVFELLVRKVPGEVLREVPAARFEEMIGLPRELFEELVGILGADGRTQGFIGQQTAGYLKNALGVTILECPVAAEFKARTGVEQGDALSLMQQLGRAATPDVEEAR